ncbi:UNVERIFIED_CONTAM: hypothetical protein DES50_102688 [Williamsia faeni]
MTLPPQPAPDQAPETAAGDRAADTGTPEILVPFPRVIELDGELRPELVFVVPLHEEHAHTPTPRRAYLGDRIEHAPNLALIAEDPGWPVVVVECDSAAQRTRFLADMHPPPEAAAASLRPVRRLDDGTWTRSDHYVFAVPDTVRWRLPETPGALTVPGEHGYRIAWWPEHLLLPPAPGNRVGWELTRPPYGIPRELFTLLPRSRRAEQAERDVTLGERIRAWGAGVTWEEILSPHGWWATGRFEGCGCPIFTAPGQHSSPKSATGHEPGCPVFASPDPPLYVWTDNAGEPMEEFLRTHATRTITRFQAVTVLRYGGSIPTAIDGLDLGGSLAFEGRKRPAVRAAPTGRKQSTGRRTSKGGLRGRK